MLDREEPASGECSGYATASVDRPGRETGCNVKENVVPLPGVLSTRISLPCFSTIFRTIASPSPEAPFGLAAVPSP